MPDVLEKSAPTPAHPAADKPARVLITEDEYIVAFDLKLRLKRMGYDVIGIAASGDDAILQTQDAQPDLVLMDIQLHGPMDGIEAARQIRLQNDVPIIFITANADQATIERAAATHAFSYLLKPFNERELQFAIDMAVAHHRTAQLLREANELLEERVKTRTAELAATNISLQNELQLHRKTLDALHDAQSVARRADRAKNEFLATISHELLTPMNGILGMVDVMLATTPSTEQTDQLNIAKASAEDLLELIQELLDFSRMQNGTIELKPATFPLREQITDLLNPLALRAKEKSLTLKWTLADSLPATVIADPNRIGHVLVNLVDNAIKFTDRGGVSVEVASIDRADSRVQLHFAVKDTGIGVPEDKRSHIFEPFVQADGSHSRRHEGVGLGLSIASKIINRMGGKIALETELGKGSTFSFDLWLDTPKQPDKAALRLST